LTRAPHTILSITTLSKCNRLRLPNVPFYQVNHGRWTIRYWWTNLGRSKPPAGHWSSSRDDPVPSHWTRRVSYGPGNPLDALMKASDHLQLPLLLVQLQCQTTLYHWTPVDTIKPSYLSSSLIDFINIRRYYIIFNDPQSLIYHLDMISHQGIMDHPSNLVIKGFGRDSVSRYQESKVFLEFHRIPWIPLNSMISV
jgi:hypothetical protein